MGTDALELRLTEDELSIGSTTYQLEDLLWVSRIWQPTEPPVRKKATWSYLVVGAVLVLLSGINAWFAVLGAILVGLGCIGATAPERDVAQHRLRLELAHANHDLIVLDDSSRIDDMVTCISEAMCDNHVFLTHHGELWLVGEDAYRPMPTRVRRTSFSQILREDLAS